MPLDSKADNSIEASTSATTLAGNASSSDTVLNVGLDQNIMWTFAYNANGDLTQKLSTFHNDQIEWNYTYSVDGWLTKVEKKVGGQTLLVEEYFYDPVGRKYKVLATAGGATTRYFVYDGGSIVLELEEDSGNHLLEKEHVRGLSLGGGIGGLLYTRDADGTTGYFHYDGQGNVVSVTNEAREEIAYYEYDAWGNILAACGSLANEFRFSTKQASLGTGLIDFGYRHYDPTTARWPQRDPIGYGDSTNLYGYVLASPTNAIDLDGLGLKKLILAGNWNAPDNVYKAAREGFWSELGEGFEDLGRVVQGAGAVSEIILGGIAVCAGNPVGIFLIYSGASSLTDAIVEGAYGTEYTSMREGAVRFMRDELGIPEWLGNLFYSGVETSCTISAGRSAGKYLRGRGGGTAAGPRDTGCRTGKIPKSARGKSWTTQRRHYWKKQLELDPRRFSSQDIERIKRGLSPIGSDGFPMELHHPPGAPPYTVQEMTRTEHRLGANFLKNHPR